MIGRRFLRGPPPFSFLAQRQLVLVWNRRGSCAQQSPASLWAPSWESNLEAFADADAPTNVRTYLIDKASRSVAFEALLRMNVTARSLFPGLDGYSKNLGHRAKLLQTLRLPTV